MQEQRTLFELTWDRGTGCRDVNNMNIRRMVQTHRRSGKERAIRAVRHITFESARDASGSPPAVAFGVVVRWRSHIQVAFE